MLIRYVTLWHWPWTVDLERSWDIKRHVLKHTKFEQYRANSSWIIDNLAHFCTCCHAVTLTFDILTLNFYSTSGVMCINSVQIWSKLNNSPLSYWRFSTFSPCNFRCGDDWQTVRIGMAVLPSPPFLPLPFHPSLFRPFPSIPFCPSPPLFFFPSSPPPFALHIPPLLLEVGPLYSG